MIEFRFASYGEYATAAELRHQMSVEMDHGYDAAYPGWRERFTAYFGDRQRRGEAQLFLASEDSLAVGMVIVSLEDAYRFRIFGRRVAIINGTFVLPRYRQSGIARRLMELAIEWARTQGCSLVRLRTSEEARRLYEKLGFKPSKEMQLDLGNSKI